MGKTFDAHVSAFQDAFSAPVPVASTSKAHLQTTSEPAAKKGKKSPSPKVQMEEDVEVDDQSESKSAEEEEEDEDGEDEDGEDNDAELSEIDEELPDEDEDDEEASDAGSDDEAAKAKETKKAKKAKLGKYVPAEESVQDKNRRTAFIGNLPIDAAKSKVRESILFTPAFLCGTAN